MLRYCGNCRHCGQASAWFREEDESRQAVKRHLEEAHGISMARAAADYQLEAQQQCDYCLEPHLDNCTKCGHDFCRFHAGDIDGLCGGCI